MIHLLLRTSVLERADLVDPIVECYIVDIVTSANFDVILLDNTVQLDVVEHRDQIETVENTFELALSYKAVLDTVKVLVQGKQVDSLFFNLRNCFIQAKLKQIV